MLLSPTTFPLQAAQNCSLGGRSWIICYICIATFSSRYICRKVLLSSRKKTGNKQDNLILFSPHVFVCIHCRYRPTPKVCLITDFRSPMFHSVAPLKMVMSADPPISMTGKAKVYSYSLNLLSWKWKQQTEVPHSCARNVQKENVYLSCSLWSV